MKVVVWLPDRTRAPNKEFHGYLPYKVYPVTHMPLRNALIMRLVVEPDLLRMEIP